MISDQKSKRRFDQFRISTFLLCLAIAALATNQIVSSRRYENRIQQLSNELRILKIEDEIKQQSLRLGPGHRTVQKLLLELKELRETTNPSEGESE